MFEDLSETVGEVQAKGQVMCMSPSLRDLPTHTQSYGKNTHTHTHTHKHLMCGNVCFHLVCRFLIRVDVRSNDSMLVSGEKRVVQLSLRSTETGHQFITTSFIYYNCSVLNS